MPLNKGISVQQARQSCNQWGLLPELSVVVAVGLLLVAIADTAARASNSLAEPLFWGAVCIVFVPAGLRLIGPQATRRERIGLVVILGLGLYLVKIFHSPLFFTFSDELLHVRTMEDILTSHHLFLPNPMLPVSPEYPGLQTATLPFLFFSGLSLYHAAVVVVGIARLVLILSLFLFYEQIAQSARIAGIGVLLYMTHPHFVFFDGMFAYESLALSLSVFVLFAGARRLRRSTSEYHLLSAVIILGIAAVITTHHVTSEVLIAFLCVWTVTFLLADKDRQSEVGPGWTMVLAIVISSLWIFSVADLTFGYLLPRLNDTLTDVTQMLLHRAPPRQLFTDDVGQRTPVWEQILSYLATVLVVLGIPPSLLVVWHKHRSKAIPLALAGGAIVYPLTQALRFTDHGLELAGRFTPFLYVALALVLALGSRHLGSTRWGKAAFQKWPIMLPVGVLIGVVFLGGVLVSFPRWGRMPGPYLVGADMRSVEPQSTQAATWMLAELGPNNRIATDRTNALLMNSYGRQRVVTAGYDEVFVPTIFMNPIVNGDVLDELQKGKIRYILVDFRLSGGLPLTGYYYDEAEHNTYSRTTPVSDFALRKFDGQTHAQKIFDSGDIAIYDLNLLTPHDVS